MALVHGRRGLTFRAAGMGQQPTARTCRDRTLAGDQHTVQSWYVILHDSRKPNPVLIRPNDNSRCPNTGISKNNDTITVMAILRAQAHPRGKDYCFLKS